MASIGQSAVGCLDQMTVGGFTNFDKLKERKKIQPTAKIGRAKIDLDEMGNPVKREKSMTGVRERAKK
jgi:hypothetical protein